MVAKRRGDKQSSLKQRKANKNEALNPSISSTATPSSVPHLIRYYVYTPPSFRHPALIVLPFPFLVILFPFIVPYSLHHPTPCTLPSSLVLLLTHTCSRSKGNFPFSHLPLDILSPFKTLSSSTLPVATVSFPSVDIVKPRLLF